MLPRPLLLDAFSGAGGCGYGYFLAGFHVIGVDINPQPHYPFEFIQDDAIDFIRKHGNEFDFIHASPPCQRWSRITKKVYRTDHPDKITPTRELIRELDIPYVIENVENAKSELCEPITLCGSMFNLRLWRHRCFEVSFSMPEKLICRHNFVPIPVSNSSKQKMATKAECEVAMSINWMNRKELGQTLPPAYTQYIGAEWLRQNGYRYQYPDVYAPKQLELFA